MTAMLLGLVPAPAAAQANSLAPRIARITSRPEFRHALWGIEFYSLDDQKTVYALNGDKLFTPGSTTKLLTMGTALALLGADHRFHTRLYRTGPLSNDSTLDGDLILLASGDPNLSARLRPDGTLAFENEDHSYDGDTLTRAVPGDPLLVIRELAQQIAKRGVKRVTGHVIVDASMFREGERELGTGVVMSPIVVNDNLVDVFLRPGAAEGDSLTMNVSPATAYVRFVNQARTGAAGSRQRIRWAEDSSLANGMHIVTIRGTMPARGPTVLFSYAVPSPTRYAEVVLAEALRDAGVTASVAPELLPWSARPRLLGMMYQDSNVVAEHVSAPYIEEVKVTLKVSQNLHASMTPMLLRALLAKGDSTKTGFDLERDFLTSAHLDVSGAQQADGAGGDAHFTPDFMVHYLAYWAKRPEAKAFQAALPVLGRDGTLFDIQPNSPAAGHVFAKTGTFAVGDPLNNRVLVTAKGLAGYMTTAAGKHLAFAIYVNNVSVPDEPDAIKRIVGQALGEVAAAVYSAK